MEDIFALVRLSLFLFAGYISVRNRDTFLWVVVMMTITPNLFIVAGFGDGIIYELVRTSSAVALAVYLVVRSKQFIRRK